MAAQFSHEQVKTLARRKVRSVTICLDPDKAGDTGILSCIDQLLPAGITPYVAPKLPDGMDPDEFIITKGIDAWNDLLDRAVHAFQYVADQILQTSRPAGGWTARTQDAVVASAIEYAVGQAEHHRDELHRHFWPVICAATGATMENIEPRLRAAEEKPGPAEPVINHQARPFHRPPAVPSWRPRRRPTVIRREVNL